jgi:tight adherence protein B
MFADPTLVTALFVFLAIALGTISVVFVIEGVRDRVRARGLVRQLESWARESLDRGTTDALLAERTRGGALDPLLARIPTFRDIANLLEQGQTRWSSQTFFLLSLGLAVALGAAVGAFFRDSALAGLAAAGGALMPYWYVKRRASLRLRAFEEQLPDGIDLIGRAIRAGHPLSAGLGMVAEEAREPVAGEFRRVFEEQRYGLAFDDSMLGMADRIPLVDVRILVTAILVQREVGGNLAEVLDNLSYVIRERFKIRRQLRVITAQGRLSGYILGALPIAVGVAVFLLNPPYIMTLFEHPIGRLMLPMAAVLQIAGYLWIRRIVDIEI